MALRIAISSEDKKRSKHKRHTILYCISSMPLSWPSAGNTFRTTNPIGSTFAFDAQPHSPIDGVCRRAAVVMVFQTSRGPMEKRASSRWPQLVARTRSWCDTQRRVQRYRQSDRPSAQSCRLTAPPLVSLAIASGLGGRRPNRLMSHEE